jgi:hypothetical protein
MPGCFLCGHGPPEYIGLYIPAEQAVDRPQRQYWYTLCAQCLQRADRLAIVERRCHAFGRQVELCRAAPMN